MKELKPCPFCGSKAQYILAGRFTSHAGCPKEKCILFGYNFPVNRWNKRSIKIGATRKYYDFMAESLFLYGDAFVDWFKKEGLEVFDVWAKKQGIEFIYPIDTNALAHGEQRSK